MKPLFVFSTVVLLALSACTQYGYVKPEASEAEYRQDLADCAEIARHQAFRDAGTLGFRDRHRFSAPHSRRFFSFGFDDFGPSSAELEFRYRRICMTARGYELVPLEEEGEEGEPSG